MFPGSSWTAVEVDPKCSSWVYCPLQPSCSPTSGNWWQMSSLQPLCCTSQRGELTSLLCFLAVTSRSTNLAQAAHQFDVLYLTRSRVSTCAPLLEAQAYQSQCLWTPRSSMGPPPQNSNGHLWELLKTNNSYPTAGPLWRNSPWGWEAAWLESSVPTKVTVAVTSSFGGNKTFLAGPAHPVGLLISSVFLSLEKGNLRPGSGPGFATYTLGCPLSHTTSPGLGYLLLENEGGICMVISKVPLNAKLLWFSWALGMPSLAPFPL